jgi:hypothetical protein
MPFRLTAILHIPPQTVALHRGSVVYIAIVSYFLVLSYQPPFQLLYINWVGFQIDIKPLCSRPSSGNDNTLRLNYPSGSSAEWSRYGI